MTNKKKIINDPLYGFVTIQSELIFDLISHPYFQRLRRIKQLGLAELVYPGALHTRFQHALGAMHLMQLALETLRSKGIEISDQEKCAAEMAILLHDLGHGPFSHVLEYELLPNTPHEVLSLSFMEQLNQEFSGELTLAIQMFNGTYERKFFHQLLSSQLDMDRMDYLNRDCFFTGVVEGTIGVDRLIKLLTVENDQLVIEAKGILSVENFLNARRLMYWQVYLHKTSIAAESMLVNILRRAKYLLKSGNHIPAPAPLAYLLSFESAGVSRPHSAELLRNFIQLDDIDIWCAIKGWASYPDSVLSLLSRHLLDRKLFKIIISNQEIEQSTCQAYRSSILTAGVNEAEMPFFESLGKVSNKAYVADTEQIKIIYKDKSIKDIAAASDLQNIRTLTEVVKKYYYSWLNPLYL